MPCALNNPEVRHAGRVQAHGHVFSFFTRNLARLAPDVVAVLEATGQAVDPNLRRLAAAFRTVADKLGADGVSAALRGEGGGGGGEEDEAAADAEGGGGAEAMPEDVEEGLAALRQEMLIKPGAKRKRARQRDAGCAAGLRFAIVADAVTMLFRVRSDWLRSHTVHVGVAKSRTSVTKRVDSLVQFCSACAHSFAPSRGGGIRGAGIPAVQTLCGRTEWLRVHQGLARAGLLPGSCKQSAECRR